MPLGSAENDVVIHFLLCVGSTFLSRNSGAAVSILSTVHIQNVNSPCAFSLEMSRQDAEVCQAFGVEWNLRCVMWNDVGGCRPLALWLSLPATDPLTDGEN